MGTKISVTLETNGNAAFDEDPAEEVARCLNRAANILRDRSYPDGGFGLYDINGNRCGRVLVEETDDD